MTDWRPILEVSGLTVSYGTPHGVFRAVDDVSFTVRAGERFGLVGESGSGKSTTVLAIMGLLRPEARVEGSIRLNGREIVDLPPAALRALRFSEVSLVPQGAMSSLNPVLRIGEQMADILIDHGARQGVAQRLGVVMDLLAQVGLPASVARRYPHELSGGMKQRVCIAMAIALRPKLILADEPTSALDVIVQRQVFATLDRVQRDLGAAIVLIGHDMALMAQFVTALGVMRSGKLLETGPARDVLASPRDPYTRALLEALPSFERGSRLSQRPVAPAGA